MIGGSCRPCSLPLSVKCEGLTAKLAFKANLTIPYNAKILKCLNLQCNVRLVHFKLIFLPGGVSFVWKEILIADSTPSCTEPLVKCLSWSQHRTFGLLGELQWKCLSWSQQETECKSVKPPALQLGLLFYVEGFSRFSAYKRHIFYAATRLNPHGLQIEYPGTPVWV